MSGFYSLSASTRKGPYNFGTELPGKVVLIVNTASACGFTPQYKGLEALYQKYKDQGFIILGFPSNQFGSQEKGDDATIETFCSVNYGVTFPIMLKSDVNGDNANEVFKWLKERKSGLLGLSRIKWNFEKFLIDRKGNVYERYSSITKPESLEKDIQKLLAQDAPAAPAAAPAEPATTTTTAAPAESS